MKNIKTELKWAVIFPAVALIWMLLEKNSGLHDRYIDYKKKNYHHGKISYRQGLLSGVLLSVLIALLSPLSQWITSYVITPEYFSNVIHRSVELGYYATVAEAEAHFNYRNFAIQSAFGALIMGVFTTLIAMLFIRTREKG